MTRDSLTRDRIIRTATTLLDATDIKSLNLRKLGQELNMATTAMYWHIPSKDDLVRLASDYIWDDISLPDYKTLGWRQAAQSIARNTHELIIQHPWLMTAMIEYNAYGKNRARHHDYCYEVLQHAGFTKEDLDFAVDTLLTYTFGSAFATTMNNDSVVQMATDFPRLQNHVQNHTNRALTNRDAGFEFGLRTILDGFETVLKQH